MCVWARLRGGEITTERTRGGRGRSWEIECNEDRKGTGERASAQERDWTEG